MKKKIAAFFILVVLLIPVCAYAQSLAFMNQAYRDLSIAALRKAGLK